MRTRSDRIVSVAFLFAVLGASGCPSKPPSKPAASMPPSRVVTLAPSLAEMTVDLTNDPSLLVGVAEYTDFPASLKSKPKIGSYAKPNLELIQTLKPDLVLATRDGNPADSVNRLEAMGVRVVTVDTRTLAEVRESFVTVARALGVEARGVELQKRWDSRLAAIHAQAARKPSVSMLVQVGDDPLVVAGGESFLSETLPYVGGRNVYADLRASYPRIAYEDAVKRDPDWIVILALSGEDEQFERMRKKWLRFGSLQAVKRGRVLIFRDDGLVRPGMRMIEGVHRLQAALDRGGAR